MANTINLSFGHCPTGEVKTSRAGDNPQIWPLLRDIIQFTATKNGMCFSKSQLGSQDLLGWFSIPNGVQLCLFQDVFDVWG